jgi:hypothetical protein
MMAAVELIHPGSIVAMKTVVLACFALACALAYLLIRRWAGPRVALLCAVLLATNRLALELSDSVMSELPFMLWSTLALLLHDQAERVGERRWRRWELAAGASAIWALLLRSIGVALVGALALRLLIRRRWLSAGVLATAAAGTKVVEVLLRGGGEGPSYLQQLLYVDWYRPELGYVTPGGLLARIGSNAVRYGTEVLPESVAPVEGASALWVVILLALLVGLGIYLARLHVAGLYALLFLAILLAWPRVWAVHRMVTPLLPVTLLLVVSGAATPLALASRRLGRLSRSLSWAVVAAVALAIGGWNLADYLDRGLGLSPRWARYYSAMKWLGAHSTPRSVLVCRKPYLGYLLSGRRTVGARSAGQQRAFARLVSRHGPDLYLVVDSLGLPGTEAIARQVRSAPERYVGVLATPPPRVLVFRRRPD